MVERAGVVLLLVVATAVVALIVRARARACAAAMEGQVLPAALRSEFGADTPGVVYFYGPHCGSCRQQAAILDQLAGREPVTILKLDAVEQTELAGTFGIATLPATVVIAPGGTVQTVNLGLRSLPVLAAQLHQARDTRAAA